MKLRADITTFAQGEHETLYEAWEHYKDLMRRCPHHQLPDGLVVQTFYYGLPHSNRTMLDAAAGGNLLRKSPEDGYELIEEMASSSYHPQSERNAARRPTGMHQVDAFTSVAAQLEVMNKRIEELTLGQSAMRIQEVWCEKCGAKHFTKDCQTVNPSYQPEGGMVNHVGNQNRPRNDPFSSTYNPGWKQHPNFSWGGQNNRSYGNQNYGRQPQEENSSMEQMMQKFISSTETRMQNQDASIKNLENQIGQLAKAMSSRELVTLPSDTEKNPKEQVKAVELRSGKIIEGEKQGEKESEPATPRKTVALKKAKLDSQFAKFLEVFKKLNINIPFVDALMQMPSYAKFLKEILSNKKKLEEHEMTSLTENCSALVQNKIPPKQKDPGSFSIPCVINDVQFHKDLCDLGASINLMPYYVFRKLSLGEPKSTRMSLQLADRSIKYPRGIIEDVLVKVDKFIFPMDFVVLDMEEDLDMPLIMGRPFLATRKELIDVQKGELHLRVGEEKISFDVFNALKFSQNNEECFQIDVVDSLLYDYVQDTFQEPLEAALLSTPHDDLINVEIEKMTAYLNDNQSWRKGGKLRLEDLGDWKDLVFQKPSIEEPPTVELKPLHTHLKYVFLGENGNLPVIISSSLTDGYSGYNQIAIAPEDQDKKTFTCPYGTFAYRHMPFGLCNAPATFQRCMNAIFHNMSFDACLNNVLMRCEETNLVLNWENCHFMVTEGIVLGHRISEQGIEEDRAKVQVIQNLPPPTTIKGVRSFLGHAGFYRRFIKDFSKIAKPLSSLLMKDTPFNFDSTCLQAFEFMREILVTAPVLTSPDWDLPFEVMCDASDSAVGAVLGQRIDKVFRAIYYARKTLNEAQFNYATTEKELLAVVFALDKFHSYLVLSKITIYTDHSAIKHLLAKKDAKPRLIRWILLLQEFDIEIKDKKKREKRLLELNHFEEFRDQAYDMAVSYKERTKRIHDRHIRQREFKEGEAVLLFNSRLRLFPGNLKSRWSGPYKITKVYPSGDIEIKDARNESFTVNSQSQKHYVGGDVDSTPVITTLTDQD
ncbi:uncharacterized protein [Henckelia pumila]|uniref:uncharacterized protein n=1 Tax=Henckelia pumila TaxID=405737 RepID=UPI003C6E857F